MSSRVVPVLVAIGVGVASGIYIWNEPLQQSMKNAQSSKGNIPPPKEDKITPPKIPEQKLSEHKVPEQKAPPPDGEAPAKRR